MNVTDLIPWSRNRPSMMVRDFQDPFQVLHRDMNRLLDDFWSGFDGLPARRGAFSSWPAVEIDDHGDELRVTVELAGLEQKDVESFLDGDTLVIKGEKRQEREDALINERFYGRFERRIPLPVEIQADSVQAHFEKGLLTITLPKSAEAEKKIKHIDIH